MILAVVTITIILLLLSVFIIGILFLYQKKQIYYQKTLENIKHDYEKTLLKTQLEIQEQTFQAIALDIHDNINLSLTLAKLNLNTLDFLEKERSKEQVMICVDYLSKAITDLTDISRSMNSDIISEQGLISALARETEKLRKLNWFYIQFEVSGNPVFMEAQKELFIFRIVQEAFNNILKHSQAKSITLHLHFDKDSVAITLTDDGIGFLKPVKHEKISANPTAGLRNMQKRAELLNGQCSIDSGQGLGTTIKISIPY